MAVVVLLGLTGVLGVRSGTVRAEGGGHVLAVTHAEVARAGWDVPFTVEVVRAGGWGDDDVVLRVSADYFAIFETQGFDPEPSAETNDGRWLYLTFDPPPGDTFTLDYDAYVQPASQRGREAEVAVLVDDAPVVDVGLRTRLLP